MDPKEVFEYLAAVSMSSIVLCRKRDLKCTYFNEKARASLEVVDNTKNSEYKITQFFANTETSSNSTCSDILEQTGFYLDIYLKRKSGAVFVANVETRSLKIGKDPYVLFMFQDMTDQKKLQRDIGQKQQALEKAYVELLEQNKELKILDVAKDNFITLVTHELRTPLSALWTTSELLHAKMFSGEEQMNQLIETVYSQSQVLLELVSDILDLAKLHAGKMEYYIHEQEIEEVIVKGTSILLPSAEKRKITLQVDDSVKNKKCYFDELRLSQVIGNVLSNAIKFNKDNGKVTVYATETSDFVKISVEDTGVGIEKSSESDVFEEFKVIGPISAHHEGTGVGMPICQSLLEGMGGDIGFESQVGIGTTFFVQVPKKRVLEEAFYRQRQKEEKDLLKGED